MTKSVKYTAIWKEWKIKPHLLRPWSAFKVWLEISYADFVSSAVCHDHYDHPRNLKIESDARSETADISVKTLELFEMGWDQHCGVETARAFVYYPFLMSTPEEQNVDWKRGWTSRIYIGFQVIKFHCFPPPPSSNPETSITFHSETPCEHCENSNVHGTMIMKCPKCSWHDYYKICPICDHQIPEGSNYIKEGFLRCHDCGAITHKNAKTLETNFYSPSKEKNKEED